MKISIPPRKDVPETSLWVETIIDNNFSHDTLQKRNTMLLVPGGPGGNHTVYNEIKEELFKYADLIVFDPRGCGYSDPSLAEYCTIDNYIEDIYAIQKHFNLEKLTLFGGSYGSMASLGYAIKYRNNVEKLILSGGSPSFRFLELAKRNLKKLGTEEQVKMAEKLFSGTFKNSQEFDEFYKLLSPLYI
jgi:proline iminopeptidase